MKFEHRMHNRLSDLQALMDRFDEWSSSRDLPREAEFAVRIVLDEIVGNIIKYGGQGNESPFDIAVDVEFAGDFLELCIEDSAPRFDPTAVEAPNLDADLSSRTIGGLGLHLVRQTMDAMTYHREAGRNVLRLQKRIRPKGETSDAG